MSEIKKFEDEDIINEMFEDVVDADEREVNGFWKAIESSDFVEKQLIHFNNGVGIDIEYIINSEVSALCCEEILGTAMEKRKELKNK